MSARKLYIGIAVYDPILPVLQERAGLEPDNTDSLPFHVTVQYCGKQVTDEDVEKIGRLWEAELDAARLDPARDLYIFITQKLDLYGKNKDNLVVLCQMSKKFSSAVERARKRVSVVLPHVPESDFAFSPHITLGNAANLPKFADPLSSLVTFDSLTMWGNDDETRDTIAIPLEHDKNGLLGLFK